MAHHYYPVDVYVSYADTIEGHPGMNWSVRAQVPGHAFGMSLACFDDEGAAYKCAGDVAMRNNWSLRPRPLIARRASTAKAWKHMMAGGTIVASEDGHRETIQVTPTTTTHSGGQAEWDELESQIEMWRNRHPNQRYYIVEDTNA